MSENTEIKPEEVIIHTGMLWKVESAYRKRVNIVRIDRHKNEHHVKGINIDQVERTVLQVTGYEDVKFK